MLRRRKGVSLVRPGSLTGSLTKTVLDVEMTEHLGYEKHPVTDSENARNGTRSKTVLTEIGPVEIEVPRNRDGSFQPKIVKKRQRRLDGFTTGEVAAHFGEVCGASVSKDTISLRRTCSRTWRRCPGSRKPRTWSLLGPPGIGKARHRHRHRHRYQGLLCRLPVAFDTATGWASRL